MQSTGQASTQAVSFVPMQGSAMTYAMGHLRCLSPYACHREDSSLAEVKSWRIEPTFEKISAVTLRVANMMKPVRFYSDVLGMELLYGGEDASFSSLRAKDRKSVILNLEQDDKVLMSFGHAGGSLAEFNGTGIHGHGQKCTAVRGGRPPASPGRDSDSDKPPITSTVRTP